MLPRLIRAQAERDTEVFSLGRKQLSVCYAYANNGVGAIEVTDSTTYRQAHDMIRPLLEEYFASNDIARAYALIENFKVNCLFCLIILSLSFAAPFRPYP